MRWQKTGQRLEYSAVDMVSLAQSAVLIHKQRTWDAAHITPLVYQPTSLPITRNSS